MDPTERRPTVLVVDDEASIRELLTASLRFEGYQVYCAEDGIRALELAQHLQPDLILLDILLPGLSGFAVTHRLRSLGYTVPVLFLSACDEPADRRQARAVGGDDFILKPFSLREVRSRVRALLSRPVPASRVEQHAVAG